MNYKENIGKLIFEIEEKFLADGELYQEWTELDQEKVNEKLSDLAEKLGVFESTANNEAENIKTDLTVIDNETGEKIELIDISNMKQRVRDILMVNNIFSLLRCVAVANKCAHKCSNNYNGLEEQIKSIRKEKEQIPSSTENSTIDFNVETLSKEDIKSIITALKKDNVKIGAQISICRTLGIDIKTKEDLNRIFCELKQHKRLILERYEEQLINKLNLEEDYRESLFWIKDQFISIIGQLLVKDNQYKNLNYEMISCGYNDSEFRNMLAIDYSELSYYIEVHMPNFISQELIEEYGVKQPIESEKRTFERLGATAVYERKDKEVEKIKQIPLINTRRRVLSRPKKENDASNTYRFITKKIQDKKDVSIWEKYFRTKSDFRGQQIKYSKMRSNENQTDIEEKIVADTIDNVLKQRDTLEQTSIKSKNDYIEEIKSFARQEVMLGDKFDKVYFMYATEKSENDFIKLIAYEKNISEIYKWKYSNDNIVEMIKFIEAELPVFEQKIDVYRKYRREKDKRGDRTHDEGR